MRRNESMKRLAILPSLGFPSSPSPPAAVFQRYREEGRVSRRAFRGLENWIRGGREGREGIRFDEESADFSKGRKKIMEEEAENKKDGWEIGRMRVV